MFSLIPALSDFDAFCTLIPRSVGLTSLFFSVKFRRGRRDPHEPGPAGHGQDDPEGGWGGDHHQRRGHHPGPDAGKWLPSQTLPPPEVLALPLLVPFFSYIEVKHGSSVRGVLPQHLLHSLHSFMAICLHEVEG
jgi:hypothetical protein